MIRMQSLGLVIAVLFLVACAANTVRIDDEPAGSLTSRSWLRHGERWVFYDNGTGVVAFSYEKSGHLSLDQPFLWVVSNRTITIRPADMHGHKYAGKYRMEINHTESDQDEMLLYPVSNSPPITLMSEKEKD